MSTNLQRVSRIINYTLGFRLQYFTPYCIPSYVCSNKTRKLANEYNAKREQLESSIKEDYGEFKRKELLKREKELEKREEK